MDFEIFYLPTWVLAHKVASVTATVALYAMIHLMLLIVYRLYFSKLSDFPGPKTAAATYWYEFYYDWLCKGKYIFKIEEMHKRYGLCPSARPTE